MAYSREPERKGLTELVHEERRIGRQARETV